MRVRLTKELDDQPAQTVARDKTPEDRPGRRGFSSDQPEDRKQQEPFEPRFVELRRMAASRPSGRKDHAPIDVGRPPIEFPVDKISQAAESQSDRRDRRSEIRNRIDGNALTSAEPNQWDDRAEQPAVEWHPAFPDCDDFGGMLDVVGKIIKEGVTQPASDKDPQGGPHDHVINLIPWDGESLLFDLPLDQKIGDGQSDQIHETVPAEL